MSLEQDALAVITAHVADDHALAGQLYAEHPNRHALVCQLIAYAAAGLAATAYSLDVSVDEMLQRLALNAAQRA